MITIWHKHDERTDEDVWFGHETEMLDACNATDVVQQIDFEPTPDLVIGMLSGLFPHMIGKDDRIRVAIVGDLPRRKRSYAAVKAHATRGTYGKA